MHQWWPSAWISFLSAKCLAARGTPQAADFDFAPFGALDYDYSISTMRQQVPKALTEIEFEVATTAFIVNGDRLEL